MTAARKRMRMGCPTRYRLVVSVQFVRWGVPWGYPRGCCGNATLDNGAVLEFGRGSDGIWAYVPKGGRMFVNCHPFDVPVKLRHLAAADDPKRCKFRVSPDPRVSETLQQLGRAAVRDWRAGETDGVFAALHDAIEETGLAPPGWQSQLFKDGDAWPPTLADELAAIAGALGRLEWPWEPAPNTNPGT